MEDLFLHDTSLFDFLGEPGTQDASPGFTNHPVIPSRLPIPRSDSPGIPVTDEPKPFNIFSSSAHNSSTVLSQPTPQPNIFGNHNEMYFSRAQLLNMIQSLSAEELLQSKNPIFRQCYERIKFLEGELHGQKQSYLTLMAQLDLIAQRPKSAKVGLPLVRPPTQIPKEEDLTKIVFPTKASWDKFKKENPKLVHDDPNSKELLEVIPGLRFMQYKDGKEVDRDDIGHLRRDMRICWKEMQKAKMAPPKWSVLCKTAQTYFRNTLYTDYPFLMLCKNHWKLDALATLDYPSYIAPFKDAILAESVNVKREEVDADVGMERDSDSDSDIADKKIKPSLKRPANDSERLVSGRLPKRQKVKHLANDTPVSSMETLGPSSMQSARSQSAITTSYQDNIIASKEDLNQGHSDNPRSPDTMIVESFVNVPKENVPPDISEAAVIDTISLATTEKVLDKSRDGNSAASVSEDELDTNSRYLEHTSDANDACVILKDNISSMVPDGSARTSGEMQIPSNSAPASVTVESIPDLIVQSKPLIKLVNPFSVLPPRPQNDAENNKLEGTANTTVPSHPTPHVPMSNDFPLAEKPANENVLTLDSTSVVRRPGREPAKYFRFNNKSASLLNLFGRDYISGRKAVLNTEVQEAFDKLTLEKLKEYDSERNGILAKRKADKVRNTTAAPMTGIGL
ncbi:hypothetical protein M422DRAFT_241955 [Sphaerobolus stellatus SS14]|nr:hypothetical protein M422DRAFT_241955 [Sphaerobolus stellatus SS14]